MPKRKPLPATTEQPSGRAGAHGDFCPTKRPTRIPAELSLFVGAYQCKHSLTQCNAVNTPELVFLAENTSRVVSRCPTLRFSDPKQASGDSTDRRAAVQSVL